MSDTLAQQRLLDPTAVGEVARFGAVTVSLRDEPHEVAAHDEVLTVLTGSGSVRFDDGESVDLRPGVCLRVAAGDRAAWTVDAPLRLLVATTRD